MHTYPSREHDAIIHYNSDLSGDVHILRGGQAIEVSGQFILDFVAHVVRSQRISQLEDASTAEILNVWDPQP